MNIRVDLNYPIKDGTEVVFRSPVDCSQITGLKVYYLEDGATKSQEFAFADAHGNNVGDIDHLFAENVVVKVILDVTSGMAFVQNADTNAYLEGRFAEIEATVRQTADSHFATALANLFNPATVVNGKFRKRTGESENAGYSYNKCAVEYGKTYTISGSSYACYYADADGNVLDGSVAGTSSTASVANVTFTVENTAAKYVYINYAPSKFPTAQYMMVEGTSLPDVYIEYGEESYRLRENVKVLSSQVTDNAHYVGAGRKHNSLIGLLRELNGDDSPKTIYIDSGKYDIFEEYGGYDFVNSIIANAASYRDCVVSVPPNTTIIGLGAVDLEYLPENDVSEKACEFMSVLDVSNGDVHIENINIRCKKCRYGIHDQNASGNYKNNYRHTYKNVRIVKDDESGMYGGKAQAFGCGFGDGVILEFESCYFKSNRLPWSVHNGRNGSIVVNNCVFDQFVNDETYYCMRFGNVSGHQDHVLVHISNCWLKTKISVVNESTAERPNAFDIVALNCKSANTLAVDVGCATNIYTPQIYGD